MKFAIPTALVLWATLLVSPTANAESLRRNNKNSVRLLTDEGPVSTIHIDGMESYCIEPRDRNFKTGNSLEMAECGHAGDAVQRWRVEEMDEYVRFRNEHDDNFCLKATHSGVLKDGAKLRLYPCTVNYITPLQLFRFEDGYIKPKADQDLCVVYRGNHLDENDPIIFKNCDTVEENSSDVDNKMWSFDGY